MLNFIKYWFVPVGVPEVEIPEVGSRWFGTNITEESARRNGYSNNKFKCSIVNVEGDIVSFVPESGMNFDGGLYYGGGMNPTHMAAEDFVKVFRKIKGNQVQVAPYYPPPAVLGGEFNGYEPEEIVNGG